MQNYLGVQLTIKEGLQIFSDVFVMTLLYMSGGRVEFPIPGLVLALSIYYTDALIQSRPRFTHWRFIQHRVCEEALGLAKLLMAPVGEAYFPPLDRCLSGESQLLFVASVLW